MAGQLLCLEVTDVKISPEPFRPLQGLSQLLSTTTTQAMPTLKESTLLRQQDFVCLQLIQAVMDNTIITKP